MAKESRGLISGRNTAEAIVEIVNLMYQNNTAANFYKGFIEVIHKEMNKRKLQIPRDEE